MFVTGYSCFACGARQASHFAGFVCPSCGGNLDIRYDYDAARAALSRGFESGAGDLFRYQALLPLQPGGPAFPLRIGCTPLYPAPRLGASVDLTRLYLKDDCGNPSASFKDRASAVVLRRAMETGAQIVSAASTGNAGSSLACLAAATGLQSVIFVPHSAPPAKLTQALSFGGRVLGVKGDYDVAFDLCLAASEAFGWLNRSTGLNPFTREGKKTCAFEIWENLGGRAPDRVVVPTGDGNMLSGIWKGWLDLKALGWIDRLPRIDCAQSVGSAAISQAVERIRATDDALPDWSDVSIDPCEPATLADSISVGRPRDGLAAVRAIIESGGETITLADGEILAALAEMASLTGVFAEPAAAAPWAAVKKGVRTERIGADECVVCIVSGSGLKDVANARQVSAGLQVIDPSLDAVEEALRL
jgi:threonine synthase